MSIMKMTESAALHLIRASLAGPYNGAPERHTTMAGAKSVADLLNNNIEKFDAADELARLRIENERLRAENAPKALRFKVSEKGAVSVYGLGRFPVTLYLEQWTRLLNAKDALWAFIDENRADLKTKGESSA